MSEVIKAVSAKLSTDTGVRVHPLLNKTGGVPAITYAIRDGMQEVFYKNSFGLTNTDFVLSIYTKTYSKLQEIIEDIKTGFHGFSGETGNIYINRSVISDIIETIETDPEELHKAILTVSVLT